MLAFAPRALLHRALLTVQVHPGELYLLIRALEAEAVRAADDGHDLAADLLFQRIAMLRELGR